MKIFVGILTFCLLLNVEMTFAGKSYSGGSSSRSSSSSSSGRSYSSGSSSRPSSGSSGSSFGGSSRSSSNGSSSGSIFGGSSKSYSPPPVSSGSKSYSGGSSKSYTPSASGSSGKTYSGGSSSSKSYTPSYTPSATSPSGKAYSGSSQFSGGSSTSGQPPPKDKPTSSTFNSGLTTAAKHEESRVRYEAATTPKTSYKTPTGQTREIKSDSPQVQTVRKYVTHERYVTYDNRASSFYGGYYSHPVYYNDSFSPFLWGWIMSDALNSHQRAMWMYHHQYDMDQARWNAMLAQDARLQAEVNALKAQNLARDAGYIPDQMRDNPDVMYNKEFVDASYNPVEVPPAPVYSRSGPSFVTVFSYLFWTIVILGISGIFVYYLFMKEY